MTAAAPTPAGDAGITENDMPTIRPLVSVCFDKNEISGTVGLWTDGPDLRITISYEWTGGRAGVTSASVNESMAMVLRDEISHWLAQQSGARPEPVGAEMVTLDRSIVHALKWAMHDLDRTKFSVTTEDHKAISFFRANEMRDILDEALAGDRP